jgi:hypothetical protein
MLWAQATNIQSVKALIPVTLDLNTSNYTRWRNMVQIAITTYALSDHLDTDMLPDEEEWLRMDTTVLCWLYGSITPEITNMVMEAPTTGFSIWQRIVDLFRDNQ